MANEIEQATVLAVPRQDAQLHFVVDMIETTANVTLNQLGSQYGWHARFN